jgi:hypothetical protein
MHTNAQQSIRSIRLTHHDRLNASDPKFGVTCPHGPGECAGNVQQLCVAKYTSAYTWWEFVMCQDYQGKDKIGDPDVALRCGRTVKIDWEGSGVGRCAGTDGSGTGEEGVQLLHESIHVAHSLGITCVSMPSPCASLKAIRLPHRKSCTIVINGETVCVHDRIWKKCEVRKSASPLQWSSN